jgi:hypothetical protein
MAARASHRVRKFGRPSDLAICREIEFCEPYRPFPLRQSRMPALVRPDLSLVTRTSSPMGRWSSAQLPGYNVIDELCLAGA